MEHSHHRNAWRGGAFCSRTRLNGHEVVGNPFAQGVIVNQRQERKRCLIAPWRDAIDQTTGIDADVVPRMESLRLVAGAA